MAEEKLIGHVSHYFDKISVAALKLEGDLKAGDQVHFVGHGADFSQTITSMQVDGQTVTAGKAGDEIGMKVDSKAKEGVAVYLVTE